MADTYITIADQHKRAYDAFSKIHEREFPMPSKPVWHIALPMLIFPVALIAIAGLALSSLRTAPVFMQVAKAFVALEIAGIEAALAVMIIEFAVLVYRIANLITEYNRTKKIPDIRQWVKVGFWSAFGILLTSNIYASVGKLTFLANLSGFMDFAISLLVAISAPLLAFVSGDIIASLWITAQEKREAIFAAYEAALANWRDGLNNRWKGERTKWGVKVKVSIPALPSNVSNTVSNLSNGQSNSQSEQSSKTTLGHKKSPDASKRVRAYFIDNPDDLYREDLSVRDLARVIGVGHATVDNVRRELKNRQLNRNGHHD